MYINIIHFTIVCNLSLLLFGCSDSGESAYNEGSLGLIPGLGRSGEGNGSALRILAWRIPWIEEPGRL